MKLRDAAIVAALVLVGGFAVADAVRKSGGERRPSTSSGAPATTGADTVGRRPERFRSVPAPGSVAFTDARDCRLREGVPRNGRERPLPPIATVCGLWAAPFGRRVAVAVPPADAPAATFRFVDLDEPGRALGGGGGLFGPVVWSANGERAAWCESATSGVALELEGEARPLAFCPRAYLGTHALAHTRDRDLLVDGRVIVAASRHIETVLAAVDGSYALVLEGGRVERRAGRRLTHTIQLPAGLVGSPLVLSPDGCAAAGVAGASVSVVDLGCFRGRGRVARLTYAGRAAAWSPDGTWLAVAEPQALAFHRVVGRYAVIRWPAEPQTVAWMG